MHIPVLKDEAVSYLNPESGGNFIDATAGQGGHTIAILKKTGKNSKVLCIDWTPELAKELGERIKKLGFEDRVILVSNNFSKLAEIVREHKFNPVNGILFDLGMSSWHLQESKRGFSFQKDEFLDMRYDPLREKLTAWEIVNNWSKKEIEMVLRKYGDQPFAAKIALYITKQRKVSPINTTYQLKEAVTRAMPKFYGRKKINPATKTFQALRIATNRELDNLKSALLQAVRVLEPEGRLVVISFHSLEDRIVKNFFRERAKNGSLKILTKKPVGPSKKEVEKNPRSRSAKLRAAVRIGKG